MKKKILAGLDFVNSAESLHKNEEMVAAVIANENAIAFCGLAYLKKGVRPILVSEDGKNYIKPNYHNSKDGIYPISRPLYYYYDVSNESLLNSFIDFSLSAEGQELVLSQGYVPVEDKTLNYDFDIDIEALFDF